MAAGSAARSGGSRIRRWWPARAASPATCRRRAGSASCAARSLRPDHAHHAPEGATVVTAAELAGGQADPADAAQVQLRADQPADPGARTWCASSASRSRRWWRRPGRRPRTSPSWSRSRSKRRRRWSTPPAALAPGAPLVHDEAAGNVVVEGRVKTPGFDAADGRGAPATQGRHPLAPAERAAARAARRACGVGCRQPPRDAHLRDADAARDAHDHRRPDRHAGIRPAGDRARRRRRLRPEDVAGARIRGRDLARRASSRPRSPGSRTGARISSPASTAATSSSRSKAHSTPMPG